VLRKVSLLVVLVVAVAAALYQYGLRVGVDGSGWLPRFISTAPDYDALEADRARQRASETSLPPVAPEVGAASSSVTNSSSNSPAMTSAAASSAAPANPGVVQSAAQPSVRDAWPAFRGLARDGRYTAAPILASWPREGLTELWRHPIGVGYASFVVAEGRAFTIEQRRAQEVVAAYDVDTGHELWTVGWDAEFRESMGGDGPRATPTYHDGRVYALGAAGEFRCLDARTGAVLWRHNILEDTGVGNLTWGMAAAPLVVDDLVVVQPGGSRDQSVVAYDRLSGERRWSALGDQQSYTSPMLVTLGGLRQILVVTARRAVGLTVDEGRLLWEFPWANNQGINAAQPLLLGNDRVFLSASYGSGAAVIQVAREGDGFRVAPVWQNQRIKNRFASSVVHEGHIYGLDESILTCIDAETGEARWKAGRYGYGQLMIAGDLLVVVTEDGRVVLVRATPDGHEELASFAAIEGKTWNHPVIADGRLIVRNGREMAAFDIRLREAGN
jgi:outer membrane protein assembly factor BamB